MKKLVSLLLLAGLPAAAAPPVPIEMTPPPAVLTEVSGEKFVTLRMNGKETSIPEGARIAIGAGVKTGFRSSAKVELADGTKLLLGRDTEIKVGDVKLDTATIEQLKGLVRASVKKREGAAKGQPRFIIRTRSAVMGVRGTDFTSEVKGDASEVHTLEGTVSVAQNEKDFAANKAVNVNWGQLLAARAGAAIPRPRSFDYGGYVHSLGQNEPELFAIARNDLASFAESYEAPVAPLPKALLSFQLAGVFMSQSLGGKYSTVELSWDPELYLTREFGARAHVGAFPLKEKNQGNTFLAYEAALLASYEMGRTVEELGAGLQTWGSTYGDPGLILMANFGWRPVRWGVIERLFVGGTFYPSSPAPAGSASNSAIQFKAGIGTRF